MRQRKFRAWDKKSKKMLMDGFIIYYTVVAIKYINNRYPSVDDLIVMDWTGKKDISGKDIWESDIVEYDDICSDDYILETGKGIRGIITYIQDRCQLMPQDIKENHKGGHYISHWDFIDNIKVIGNIHKNPKLLEQKCLDQ